MSADCSYRRKDLAIVRLYRAALGCFPEVYRREYSDELLYAVRMAAANAKAQGRIALLRLALRELRDLPLAIVHAHLHERSVPMNLQPGAHLPDGPIRNWQLGAVFLPFLLPLLFPLRAWAYENAISWLIPALGLPFLGLLVVVLAAGLVRKFPVWALPALGIVLFFVTAFLQLIALFVVFSAVMLPVYGQWGWPEGLSLAENIGIMLLVQLVFLVFLAAVVTGLLRIVPHFQARVQQEWTLLSFLLYGIAIVPDLLWSDTFNGIEWYQIASSLALVVGAGLYLAVPKRWQRTLALVVPAVLSPVVMSLGLYLTSPALSRANPADISSRLWEALQPVLYHSPLVILLLLAALAPRLPWSGRREPTSSPSPNAPVQESE